MNLVKIKCASCKKEYLRQKGRVNEAIKFGWKQYCSKECRRKGRTVRVEKACGNTSCNKLVSRLLNEFKRSKSGFVFCSRSCAAKVNNRKHPKRKRQVIAGGRKIYLRAGLIICVKCGKKSQGKMGRKYCSTECKQKALRTYTTQQLIKIIKKKVYELKRVPAKRELKKVARACEISFGSWNNAIIAAGFTPNRSHDNRMYKRAKAKAIDGHLCDSISELLIDNWLYKNNIPHKRNALYPKTHYKTDWEVLSQDQKIFVEYFGLANDSPRYDRTVKEKKKLCRRYKIKLIEIYHWDLYPKKHFDNKLKDKFEEFI